MSVSNIVSSFSPTAFFKADGHVPPMALAAGLGIGATLGILGDLGRIINDINMRNPDVQKGIAKRVRIATAAWRATPFLAIIELVFRHSGFGILAVASAGVSTAVILSIKWEVQKNSSSFQGDTQAKVARAVGYVFLCAILNIVALTLLVIN